MPLHADLKLARAWLAVCAGLALQDDVIETDGALFAACGRSGPEPLVPWARDMAGGRWVRTGLSTEDGRVVLELHLTAPALRAFVCDLESALEVYDRVAAGEIWQPSSHGSNWVVPDGPANGTGDDR